MQGVQDYDEIGLVGHHRVDVLVGRRDLVDEHMARPASHTLPFICSARSVVLKSFFAFVRL
jgi:hypothetical protein